MTDDITQSDVDDLLSNVSRRDITEVRHVGLAHVQFFFDVGSHVLDGTPFDGGRYALEISIGGPHVWLHDYDGETETLYTNKCRY